MNLQPIYPGRQPEERRLLKACENCRGDVLTGTGFADLDGAPFKAYRCILCVHYDLKRSAIVAALEERDRRERTFYPGRYALAGRVDQQGQTAA